MNWHELVPLLASLIAVGAVSFAFIRKRVVTAPPANDQHGYKRLFDQAFDGAIVLNVANGRIHLANQRAADLLGHSLEALSTKSIFDLHFPEDLDRSSLRIADAWSEGGLVYDDIPFRTAAGERLPVECSVKVTEHLGRPAVVLYMRDIRERLRLQQEIAERNALVELQNNELLSGLRYAQGIQQAMLPSLSQVRAGFIDAFILYRPRDIVSGDFYWTAQAGPKSILAVADCTGHGVPGALLSMTGITLLQGIVSGRGVTSPARVLGELRSELLRSLAHQEGDSHVRDGMNIGIISYDRVTRECEFSGALCPLYIVRANGGGLEEVKGDRIPVGYHEGTMRDFTPHLIALHEGDRLFLGSDGFADQFGGPQGRKLKTAGMKEMIARVTGDNLCRQARALEHGFLEWKGGLDQLDDVTLVGVQV